MKFSISRPPPWLLPCLLDSRWTWITLRKPRIDSKPTMQQIDPIPWFAPGINCFLGYRGTFHVATKVTGSQTGPRFLSRVTWNGDQSWVSSWFSSCSLLPKVDQTCVIAPRFIIPDVPGIDFKSNITLPRMNGLRMKETLHSGISIHYVNRLYLTEDAASTVLTCD